MTSPTDGRPSPADAPARKLAALQALAGGLTPDSAPAEAADLITGAVLAALGAGLVLLCRLSEDGSRYQIVRALGAEQAEADAWAEFPVVARVPIADAVRARQPLYLQSWEEREAHYPQSDQVPTPERGGALAAIPLLAGDRAVGGLGVILPAGRTFGEEDRNFLRAVGQLSADALERMSGRDDAEKQEGVKGQSPTAPARVESTGERLRQLGAAVESATEGITIGDARQPDLPITYANPAFLALTGYAEDEVLGRNCRFLQGTDTDPEARRWVQEALAAGQGCRVTLLNYKKDGTAFWNDLTLSPVRDSGGHVTHFIGVQSDITARVEAEDALRQSEARYRLLAENTSALVARLSLDSTVLYASPASLPLLGYRPDELIGQKAATLLRAKTWARLVRSHAAALASGGTATATLQVRHRDGRAVWLATVSRLVRDPNTGEPLEMSATAREIGLRPPPEEAERVSAALSRKAEELQALLDVLPIAVLIAEDPDCAVIHANTEGQRLLAVSPDENVSMSADADQRTQQFRVMRGGRDVPPEELPMQVAAATGQEVRGTECNIVHADGRETVLLGYSAPLYATEGQIRGSIGAFVDATPLKRLEADLLEQATRFREQGEGLRRSEARLTLGTQVASLALAEIDYDTGLNHLSAEAAHLFGLGAPAMTVPRATIHATFYPDDRAALEEQITACLDPKGAGWFAMDHRVVWPTGETRWLRVRKQVFFAGEGASRRPTRAMLAAFDITVEKAAEVALQQAQREAEDRAHQEALLGRIGQALRTETDPERVLETAVSLLGASLGADRCYYAVYDLGRGVVTIARDAQRADLPPIRGVYRFPNTAGMFRELYQGASTSVIEDTYAAPISAQTRANMDRLGLRSRVSASLVEREGFMATLTAAMADGPRAWTDAEVALVEAVATQTRIAVEFARIAQREHRLAEQFQAALQPATPASVAGMALASFYRPAWEDHGVGGDFSDVFAADKGISYLIVGDLSGKGIPAANQVATVRHMLRFALYNGGALSEAITALNATLAENSLLDGFATLFVGRYDAEAGTLTYVNAGQDAGLVLRASTGEVEALPPTGPVLGGFAGFTYTEAFVALDKGDAVALYTDGLTEAGPTRLALLTGDGVADLLHGLAGMDNPREIAQRLMAGVDAHAGAGVRDDQCLLVGVVSRL